MGRSVYGDLTDSGKKRNGMIAENQVTFEYMHPNLQCSKDRDLSLVLVFPERDSGK